MLCDGEYSELECTLVSSFKSHPSVSLAQLRHHPLQIYTLNNLNQESQTQLLRGLTEDLYGYDYPRAAWWRWRHNGGTWTWTY